MNTMNMPGFTAEDSLYKTSGHYQTGRHAVNLPTQMIGTIHVAATKLDVIDVPPGEDIYIFAKWPPDAWTPPSWGGHGTGAPVQTGPGGGRGGGGSGSGGTKQPKRRRRIETLGDGPLYSDIQKQKHMTCKNAGVGASECHSSCAGKPETAFCYYCETSSDQCTVFYDCTSDYCKTR